MAKAVTKREQEFREYNVSSDVRVDRAAGVIKNVKVLGYESKNGRRYSEAAAAKAMAMYEGIAVNVNHPAHGAEGRERPIEDRFGWLEGVRKGKDGIYADLRYLKADPRAEKVAEIAESNPALIGMSHHAYGTGKQSNGVVLVEQITRVKSVDLVCDPATTRGLFEAEGYPMDDEAMGAAPAGSGDMTWDLFLAEARKIYDGEGDGAAKASMLGKMAKKLFKVADELANISKPEEKPVEDEAKAEEASRQKPSADVLKLQEEIKALKTERSCVALLESAGVKGDALKMKALAALTDDADRKALVETWRGQYESAKPKSGGPLYESRRDGERKAPTNPKEFAALLR